MRIPEASAYVTSLAAVEPPPPPAPRTEKEVEAYNRGNGVNGNGDVGGTYSTAKRAPFGPTGSTPEALGQAALERTLADTATSSQIQDDEFEVIDHGNGKYTLVLPGVTDLSHPHWGLDNGNRTVRDVDQFALPSSADASVDSNRYAQMVRDYVLTNIPPGSDVMLVGHSFGADTAVDLAADPTFNNPVSGVNVTHVVAAAYFNQPQLSHVPQGTQVLVLQNSNDRAVQGEGVGYTVTEARNAAGRVIGQARESAGDVLGIGRSLWHGDFGGALDHGRNLAGDAKRVVVRDTLPWPDAAALVGTGVRQLDSHTVVARFEGGTSDAGHAQKHYIDYINGGGSSDRTVSDFYASVAEAGYAAPGRTQAVDVSVPDPNYRTTYPGDDTVNRARGLWDRVAGVRDTLRDGAVSAWNHVPGNDAVESAAGSVIDHLPFNNVAVAGVQALAGRDHITLDADATQEIQQDPGFLQTEAGIVQAIKARDGYGQRAMDIPLSDLGVPLGVELGGQRGQGSMWDQAKRFWDVTDPNIRATWGVAGNELTWLLRHARLDGTAHVSADGKITIDYGIHDKLDLRPGAGRSSAYNAITTVTGAVWHDVLGAPEAQVDGRFTRSVN